MKVFNSINDILDFAIKEEIKAANLYADLSKKSKSKEMQKVFSQFSKEELGHKKKLESIKGGGEISVQETPVQDMQIADYLIDVDKSRDDLSYQEALIIAMKEEKAAFKLYHNLALRINHPETKKVFLMLAQEEAKHKLRFEIEYDDYVLKEN